MNTKILAIAAATAILGAGAAVAQTPPTAPDTGATYTDTTIAPVEEDDNDMDWGWLGLLGLAGLLGLKKRRDEDVHTRPTTTTTMKR